MTRTAPQMRPSLSPSRQTHRKRQTPLETSAANIVTKGSEQLLAWASVEATTVVPGGSNTYTVSLKHPQVLYVQTLLNYCNF